MQIGILGPVYVAADAAEYEIRADKVRALLAALALDAGRVVSHVDLVDELWSGQPPANARNALQAHATRLRRALGDAARRSGQAAATLRSVRNGYLLDCPAQDVDAHRFVELAAEGAAVLYDRPERALELLHAGLRLWRGPALLDAGDGLRCRTAAALLDERRIAVWEDLISARLAVGDERRAVPELRQLVAQYPLRERFRDQLMLALYRSDRQGDALELFHQMRRLLDEELGLRPSLALQQRYAEILAQDPVLARPSAVWSDRREPVGRPESAR